MTPAPRTSGAGLSTFSGVFTPSVLTILGLVLFLRLGTVVGSGGWIATLLILALATTLVLLTSISLSAIATNLRVKAGGDYYLISRSLGVEFGGAIGIVLYLAQSISIAFYAIGFGVALEVFFPAIEPRLIAAAAVLFLSGFAWAGADVATRFQYVVMAALGAALVSFFVGGVGTFSADQLAANRTGAPGTPGFWALFALFFPAVTGFTQGVSMSGDLKDPGKSLPNGTFAAVGLSTVVYAAATIVLAGALGADVLVADEHAMGRVAWWSPLIGVGIIAATLSSGLTSFLGAPRILQALAADRVFPVLNLFSVGVGPAKNPRRGVLLSLAIALTTVSLGGIDAIAPIVTMFFLVSYGLLNYATALEARARSPSFRPRFRFFHHRASLLGALGCLGAMLMINAWAAAIAVAVLFAVYQYVDRLGRPERWSDSKRDHYFQRVRGELLALARTAEHPRHWRPRLLVFSDQTERREQIARFASWIEGGSGLTTVARILEGSGEWMPERRAEATEELRADLAEAGIEAFPLAIAAPDLAIGAQTLVQAHGLGPLHVNTVVLNWLDQARSQRADPDDEAGLRYARQLLAITRIGANVVVVDAKEDAWRALAERPSSERVIDVWWRGRASSRLMLLLAYMMKRTESWAAARIRLLSTSDGRHDERIKSYLEETLEAVRIAAEVQTVPATNAEELVAASAEASVVFLPLRLSGQELLDPFGEPIAPLLEKLPLAALVHAVEDIELGADPDEGAPARVAAASDAAEAAAARARDLGKRAKSARAAARKRIAAAREAPDDEEARAACTEAVADARRLSRQVAKARGLAATAAAELERLSGEPDQGASRRK